MRFASVLVLFVIFLSLPAEGLAQNLIVPDARKTFKAPDKIYVYDFKKGKRGSFQGEKRIPLSLKPDNFRVKETSPFKNQVFISQDKVNSLVFKPSDCYVEIVDSEFVITPENEMRDNIPVIEGEQNMDTKMIIAPCSQKKLLPQRLGPSKDE